METPSTLLAIDPGNCTGWAYFQKGQLMACGVGEVKGPQSSPILGYLRISSALVIEVPQVYSASKSKGDPNDLIKVAVQVGRWLDRADLLGVPDIVETKPTSWKGQVPKTIHHERARKVLAPYELDTIPGLAKTTLHNCLDAVCLGLWRLGRLR